MNLKSIVKGFLVVFLLFGITSSYAQFNGKHTYIAKLKEETGPVDIKVGDYTLFSINLGDEFLYDAFGKQAWMPNGNFGKIDEDMIERIPNSDYFKFDYSIDYFKFYPEYEVVKALKSKGIDYQEMVNGAITGNEDQLQQLFLLINVLEGTVGELHKTLMWKVFNRWEDEAFHDFLDKQVEDTQKSISQFLWRPEVLWPIESPHHYFDQYYPTTFEIVRKYKDL